MKKTYLNKWFAFDFNGTLRRAQCVDIEFGDIGLGPLFLMRSKYGNLFWLTRREINEHVITK